MDQNFSKLSEYRNNLARLSFAQIHTPRVTSRAFDKASHSPYAQNTSIWDQSQELQKAIEESLYPKETARVLDYDC